MKKLFKKLYDMKLEISIGLVLAFVMVTIISRFLIIGTIPSPSMFPTLKIGEKVLGEVRYKNIDKGDIYIFSKDKTYMIKRLIAKGGDHVVIKDKDVYVNGELLNEQYVIHNILIDQSFDIDITVPEKKLFFLGDNRGNSNDSRLWKDKFIDESDVVAHAKYIIYPFSKIGTKVK